MMTEHGDPPYGSPALPFEEPFGAPSGRRDGRVVEYRSGARDIQRLAGQSPGIDARAYFDCRERTELEAAVAAWPFLVRLLGMEGEAAPGTPAPADPLRG